MSDPIEEGTIQVPIEWNFEGAISRYATNMLIQHSRHEFILSFFEIRPPVLFDESEKDTITSVKAECVARVIVAADRMQDFVDAIQGNLDNYRTSFPSEESDNGNGK